MLADDQNVAVLQRVASDALFIDERSVRALEVLDHVVVAGAEDTRVMARDRRIVDHDGVVRQPADRHHQPD